MPTRKQMQCGALVLALALASGLAPARAGEGRLEMSLRSEQDRRPFLFQATLSRGDADDFSRAKVTPDVVKASTAHLATVRYVSLKRPSACSQASVGRCRAAEAVALPASGAAPSRSVGKKGTLPLIIHF